MPLRGGGSCGRVRYTVTAPLKHARSCHCSKCRNAFSGAGSAYAEVEPGAFAWTAGESELVAHETVPGWGLQFCGVCGDGDPGVQIEMHCQRHATGCEAENHQRARRR